MIPHPPRCARAGLILLAALGSACAGPAHPPIEALRPPPTEHRRSEAAEEAEEERQEERRAWFDAMHRAPEGVDWRALERANGEREQARRRALLRAGEQALGDGRWTEIGSSNQAGRMHVGALGPSGDALYGGSAEGGLWRTPLGERAWEPLGDDLYGGAHDALILPGAQPGDPDVLFVTADSGRVNVSRDDGRTWERPEGLDALADVRGIAAMGDDAGSLLVYGDRFGRLSTAALWVSTDRGRSFEVRWTAPGAPYHGSLWAPRIGEGSRTTAYVAHQGDLYRCLAPAFTCERQGTFDRRSDTGVLAGSEAGAPTLYAAAGRLGSFRLHRSDDGGATWRALRPMDDFWGVLTASLKDPMKVVYGGVELSRSVDGGARFRKVNSWEDYYDDPTRRLHADLHGVRCWPHPTAAGKEQCAIGTDGGLYLSDDFAATVENISLSGLGVGQYYSTLTSSRDADLIAAGAQDQGYQLGRRRPSAGAGPSTPFDQLISGDYGHLTSPDGTLDLCYSTYPGFVLAAEGEASPAFHLIDFPQASGDAAWLPPVAADPQEPEAFYFASDRLWRYTRQAPDLWIPEAWGPADFPGAYGAYLSALAVAPSDPSRIYAATDAGVAARSDDGGRTFEPLAQGGPIGNYLYGQALAVSATDPDEVVLGGSGYDGPAVYRSRDGGRSWTPLAEGLPPTLVYGLALSARGDVYAATEAGAYRWRRGASAWENLMGADAPITIWWSVELVEGDTIARFGTYGRGIWDYAVDAL